MGDLAELPSATRDMLRGAMPRGPGLVRFSLKDTPEQERPSIYREFFGRSLFRLDVEPMRDVPFEANVTLQRLPQLQVLSGTVQGSRNQRTREMLADGADDFSLMVNLGGPYIVSHGRREIVLGDGEATLISVAEPASFTHYPPGDVLALRCPRAPFVPLVAGVEDCYLRRVPSHTPALRLLRDYVAITRDERTLASCEVQHLIVSHIYDLMAVAIGATRDFAQTAQERGLRAARLHAIKQDIARHLDEADLSVAALAARHCCTERSVQRLFEMEGTTFTEYVLAQRLARAHRLLTDPRRSGEKISTVAYDCGFADISYFNRAFRRSYGAAPSDIRAQARHAAPAHLM
jgi:AraC-like DNA-binding protein